MTPNQEKAAGLTRCGVLGLGIGMAHADAAARSDRAVLYCAVDRDPERRRAFSDLYPDVPVYASYEEMLAGGRPDLLSVCLPTGLHAEYAVRALEDGMHVLTEKPADVTVERALRIPEAEARTGRRCGVVFQNRYNYGLDPVWAGLADGTLGKPLMGTFDVKWYRDDAYYAANGGWRGTWAMDGGGSLMNQSIHTVDLMIRLMGRPVSVSSQMRVAGHGIETEDMTVSSVRFASGAIGSFVSTTCAYPGVCTAVNLICENGTAALDDGRLTLWKRRDAPEDEEEKLIGRYGIGNRRAAKLEPGRLFGHRRVLDDMVRSVAEDREPPIPVSEALESLRFIEAVYASARQGGKAVEIG